MTPTTSDWMRFDGGLRWLCSPNAFGVISFVAFGPWHPAHFDFKIENGAVVGIGWGYTGAGQLRWAAMVLRVAAAELERDAECWPGNGKELDG